MLEAAHPLPVHFRHSTRLSNPSPRQTRNEWQSRRNWERRVIADAARERRGEIVLRWLDKAGAGVAEMVLKARFRRQSEAAGHAKSGLARRAVRDDRA